MVAALVPSATYNVEPNSGYKMVQISYTKGSQNDTIDVSSYATMRAILFVWASDDTAGAKDEVTWSGTTITLTDSTTGTGSMIVVGY